MSKIIKRGITADAVDETIILLNNNAAVRAVNNAGTANVSLFKANTSDFLQVLTRMVIVDAVGTNEATSLSQLNTGLATKISTSSINVANGVAGLDAGGKVSTAQLPASVLGALSYKGTYDASTGVFPTSPSKGDYYVISVAGTISSHAYVVGDWITYDGTSWDFVDNSQKVSSVNGAVGAVVLTTSNITEGTNLYYTQARFDSAFTAKSTTNLAEGSNLYYTQARFDSAFTGKSTSNLSEGTNLYFTNARAIGSVLTGYVSSTGTITASDTILSAIQKLNGNIAAAATSFTRAKQNFTLIAADITNQYITLSNAPLANSIILAWQGLVQSEGLDYTVSGTRVSFIGDLASTAAGDKISVQYAY